MAKDPRAAVAIVGYGCVLPDAPSPEIFWENARAGKSALRPLDGIIRSAQMLRCSWQEVWPRFSNAPARFMGLPFPDLKVGSPANFCLVETTSANEIRSIQMFV